LAGYVFYSAGKFLNQFVFGRSKLVFDYLCFGKSCFLPVAKDSIMCKDPVMFAVVSFSAIVLVSVKVA